MKIIFKKQAKKLAQDFRKSFEIILKQHGIKPKEIYLFQLEKRLLKSLGVKNEIAKN